MDILPPQQNNATHTSPSEQLLTAPNANKKFLKWGIISIVILVLLSSITGAYYLGLNNGR